MDEGAEALIYHKALSQTTATHQQVTAEALAEAEALLGEFARQGRYPDDGAPGHRKTDRLRLAQALMRARRKGIEDGVTLHAWWHNVVPGDHPPAPHDGPQAGAGSEEVVGVDYWFVRARHVETGEEVHRLAPAPPDYFGLASAESAVQVMKAYLVRMGLSNGDRDLRLWKIAEVRRVGTRVSPPV